MERAASIVNVLIFIEPGFIDLSPLGTSVGYTAPA
jgi:hypothetical protein